MKDSAFQIGSLVLSGVALVCWVVMFFAGTDVWHSVGRPDFWRLSGAPYADLRASAYAFYVLVPVLFVQVVLTLVVAVAVGRTLDGTIAKIATFVS